MPTLGELEPGTYFDVGFAVGKLDRCSACAAYVEVYGRANTSWALSTDVTVLTPDEYAARTSGRRVDGLVAEVKPTAPTGECCAVAGCINPMRSATTGALTGARGMCYTHWRAALVTERTAPKPPPPPPQPVKKQRAKPQVATPPDAGLRKLNEKLSSVFFGAFRNEPAPPPKRVTPRKKRK